MIPPLAPESGVELWVNGSLAATLMCTPRDLDDLAWGHLASRGLVANGPGAARPRIAVCENRSRVDVQAVLRETQDGVSLADVVASGCGSGLGTGSQEAAFGRLLFVKAIQTGFSVGLGELADLLKDMFSRAALHGETGGMHCAALARRVPGAPQGWESIIREDVGRHNAVDKAIGRAIAEGWELRACALITSGRIAADMAIKAMNCGVPLLASRSIPTTTAYELAVRGGITLAGRIGSVNPSVYTHPERIRQEVPHVR